MSISSWVKLTKINKTVVNICKQVPEVKHFCIFFNLVGKDGLGEQSHAALDVPPDNGLGGALAVLLGNPHQDGVLQDARPPVDKRGVGRDFDASLLAESDQFLLGKERMDLDLQHGRLYGPFIQEVLDLLRVEVGHPDTPDQPLGHQLLHCEPGSGGVDGRIKDDVTIVVLGQHVIAPLEGRGEVHEVEVKVVKAEVAQGLPACVLHVIRMMLVVPELPCHEDILPGDPRGTDAIPNLLDMIETYII